MFDKIICQKACCYENNLFNLRSDLIYLKYRLWFVKLYFNSFFEFINNHFCCSDNICIYKNIIVYAFRF